MSGHCSEDILDFCVSHFGTLCFTGVTLTPGQKVTAVVLHVDILSTCVYVSVRPKLVRNKKSVSVTLPNAIC